MVHAGVAGVARVNRVCHTHSWRVDRALGQGVARVAVEARRGGGRRFALALSVSYSPDLAYLKVLRLQAWGACTTLRPSRKGYGFGSPVTGAEQKPRPLFGSRLFRLRSTLHALWRAVWGLPQGGAGPVPVCQPCTVCRLFLGRERRQVFKPVDRSHHGYNPGESHLPPHS